VQYGARICAFAVYLLHGHFVPEDRLAELMGDLFGVRLVPATIARMSRSCAQRLQGFIEAVRDRVSQAKVKHMDETGFRIGGRTQWLHVFSTSLLTFYRVSARRGGPPHAVSGIVVHALEALLHDDGCAARLVQCASSARVEGSDATLRKSFAGSARLTATRMTSRYQRCRCRPNCRG
jgi:Transposase IS66 family